MVVKQHESIYISTHSMQALKQGSPKQGSCSYHPHFLQ